MPEWRFPREDVDEGNVPPWQPTCVDYTVPCLCTAISLGPTEAMPVAARAKFILIFLCALRASVVNRIFPNWESTARFPTKLLQSLFNFCGHIHAGLFGLAVRPVAVGLLSWKMSVGSYSKPSRKRWDITQFRQA